MVLIMRDISIAIDLIDHSLLLKRLEVSIGIKERTLTLVSWYLADGADKTSPDVGLHFGVTQGSILGSTIIYYVYTKSVGEITKRHNNKCHCYPDDTQYVILN